MPNTDDAPRSDAGDDATRASDRPAGGARLVLSTILGVSFLAFPFAFGFLLLANIGNIGTWLLSLSGPVVLGVPLLAVIVYIAFFALTSGLGLLPTYAQAILGGWIFGFVVGVPGALLGFTLGALIGWGFCRLVARDAVTRWVDERPRWRAVRRAFVTESPLRTLGLVTLVRFPPNSPFALTNLAMAASGVRLLPYAVGTFLGMTPRTVVACVLASSAAATGAMDIQTFVSERGLWPLIVGVVVLIAAFSIMSRIANRAIERAIEQEPT